VSAKGQVSGLTEYAGKEVMVILVPKEGKAIKPTVEYFYHELQKAAEEHMELAFKSSQQLKDTFDSPEAAVNQFFEKYTPESVQKLRDDMENWLKVFMSDTLKGQMEDLINQQMKQAFKQYEELRETFSSPEDATREFVKKYAPKSAQKVVEDVDAWVEKIAPKTLRDEIQSTAQEHMKLAFKQYEDLNKTFGSPNDATQEFMKKYSPESVNKLMEDMQSWLDGFKPKTKKK
jgi:uncharacterized protein YeaO (DUF488 family)